LGGIMSYARKIDANQPEIVAALRKIGVKVEHLHAVGKGVPDLLCSVNGWNFLIEIKDGAKVPSDQKLTPDQVTWHAGWAAVVHVANSVDAALKIAQDYKMREAA
jgi:hypothetical protein